MHIERRGPASPDPCIVIGRFVALVPIVGAGIRFGSRCTWVPLFLTDLRTLVCLHAVVSVAQARVFKLWGLAGLKSGL